ncbi:MAG: hypothetical protein U5R48_01345 [Gammaproteobacteria bacterium]|nr:hypothetical protein [Gammaproteobacteria bacterium]
MAELRERADAMRDALMQGLGAVRLAASQVDRSAAAAAPQAGARPPWMPTASLDAIVAALDACRRGRRRGRPGATPNP